MESIMVPGVLIDILPVDTVNVVPAWNACGTRIGVARRLRLGEPWQEHQAHGERQSTA